MLRGSAIECITIVANLYGKDAFRPYLPRFMEVLNGLISQNVDQTGEDIQK